MPHIFAASCPICQQTRIEICPFPTPNILMSLLKAEWKQTPYGASNVWKTNSTPVSLPLKVQCTERATVKWATAAIIGVKD